MLRVSAGWLSGIGCRRHGCWDTRPSPRRPDLGEVIGWSRQTSETLAEPGFGPAPQWHARKMSAGSRSGGSADSPHEPSRCSSSLPERSLITARRTCERFGRWRKMGEPGPVATYATPGAPGMGGTFESAEDRVLPDLIRLHLLCLLETTQWRRFIFLCQTAGISQDRLKRHFLVLRSAGYVVTRRSADQAGWALLTSHGARRRAEYLDALMRLPGRTHDQVQAAQQMHPSWFGQVTRP
jgi:hypothetical protein